MKTVLFLLLLLLFVLLYLPLFLLFNRLTPFRRL